MSDMAEKERNRKEQDDILDHKDHVTTGSRGIQQWGEEGLGGMEGEPGEGTVARQARVRAGQRREVEQEGREHLKVGEQTGVDEHEPEAEDKEQKGKPEAVNLEREEPITTAARRRAGPTPGPGAPERGDDASPRDTARTEPDWGQEMSKGTPTPLSETTSERGGQNLQGTTSAAQAQGSQNRALRENVGGQSSEHRVGETIEEGNPQRRREVEERDRRRQPR